MISLRDYQDESVTKAARSLALSKKVVIVAPTASGKSIICAEIIRRYLDKNPTKRVLVLCHQGHLLTQNEGKIHDIMPNSLMRTGIYCAAEGRKETRKQIILASRDSLGRDPTVCGKFSLVIVDEAHLVDVKAGTDDSDTYYSRIFKYLGEGIYVVGLTGTPWRLAGGKVYGENKFFERLAYEIKMKLLIDRGYLSQYVIPEGTEKIIDTTGMRIGSNGDYTTKDLEEISMPEPIINRCLDQWEKYAKDRKVSIFFCCSVDHAKLVEKLLHLRLKSNEIAYIDGSLVGDARKEMLENISKGQFRAIVNIGVLTTGFDAPIIDCVVMLRATASPALFVQSIGRGLRVCNDKDNCLILDMAGNFERFGSLEEPIVEDLDAIRDARKKEREEEEKEKTTKCCQVCGSEWPETGRQCSSCGFMQMNHTDEVFTLAPKIYDVQRTTLEDRETRAGDKAVVATYHVAIGVFFSEWLLIGKAYFGQKKAIAKYENLKRGNYKVKRIKVTPNMKSPKYPRVDVIEWDSVEEGKECLHHSVETQYSDSGVKITFCNDCEEIL